MRQLLIEHLVLASLGGIAAIVLASWIVSVIPKVVPERLNLFGTYLPEIDARVLAFSFVVVLATGILFGFAPALRASRASVMSSLGVANRAAGLRVGHRHLRSAFQAVQVALTLVVLAGMGLLLRSYVAMIQTKPGFKMESLFCVGLSLPPKAYPSKAQQDAFFDGLLERIGTHPRVVTATMGLPPPTGLGGRFVPEGSEKIPGIASFATLYHVRPDYFAVTGIPIRTGRTFGPQDGPADPPVAIIDAEAARRYWPGRSALGQRFRYSPYVPWITVVGVAGHVKTESFTTIDGDVQAYLPLSQVASATDRSLLFRSEGDPSSVFASVRAHVRVLDGRVTVGRAGAVADLYDRPLAGPRVYLLVMSMFGFLALATSGVGLYALLSYSVNQRTQEIGIRMALGADYRRVRSFIVREALGSVVAGIVFGTIVSYWLTRVLDWQLYHTTRHDPVTYAGVVLILLGVAALAAFLPARRATRVDPVEALRAE